jgi:hypothetical protein
MEREHDEDVMEMNEIPPIASGRVHCAVPNVGSMIDGTDRRISRSSNAKMSGHHGKHYRHTSHRHHNKMGAIKAKSKVSFRGAAHTTKRG